MVICMYVEVTCHIIYHLVAINVCMRFACGHVHNMYFHVTPVMAHVQL